MTGVLAFRRKLAHRLNAMAGARWQAAAGQPSGGDLKFITRCNSLAVSAETLAPQACAEVEAVQADPRCAGRFADLWREMPDALGVTIWPRTAGDLVAWLVHQADHDPALSRRDRAAGRPPRQPVAKAASSAPLSSAVARDFTGALAVVAPVLSALAATTAVRDWREARVTAHRPAVQAVVIDVTSNGGRAINRSATIAFLPTAGAPECRVTLPLGNLAVSSGATLSVVPRSAVCEAPLVPATLGDPAASLSMALAFAAASLIALKVWGRLARRPAPTSGFASGHRPMSTVF